MTVTDTRDTIVLREPITVSIAELGDDAGLLGAACWYEATGANPRSTARTESSYRHRNGKEPP